MANATILEFIRTAQTDEKAETLAGLSIDAVLGELENNRISYGQAIRSIKEYRKAANHRHETQPSFIIV